MLGGERVTDDVSARWGEGRRLFIGYGPPRRRHSRRGRVHWPRRPTADRRPPRHRCRRARSTPAACAAGGERELYLAGDRLAAGYDGDGARTAERFVAAPVAAACTGPETSCGGSRHRPVRCLDFRGRSDDQVKIRGVRVEPAEVDAVLRSLPGVRSAVTVPREHGDGHALYSYVVPESCDPARVRAALVDRLPAPMIPTAILTTDSIPLTATGRSTPFGSPSRCGSEAARRRIPPMPWSRRRTPRRSGPTWTVLDASSSSEAIPCSRRPSCPSCGHGSDASSPASACSTSRPSAGLAAAIEGWPVRGSRRRTRRGHRPERLAAQPAQQRMWTQRRTGGVRTVSAGGAGGTARSAGSGRLARRIDGRRGTSRINFFPP